MIEPYRTIIEDLLQKYQSLSLKISTDSDYQITLANNRFTFTIATERGYQPSVSAVLTDRLGEKFELGLSERILAKDAFFANVERLANIKKSRKPDHASETDLAASNEILSYVETSVGNLFDFVFQFGEIINSENRSFCSEYKARESAMLARFGVGFRANPTNPKP